MPDPTPMQDPLEFLKGFWSNLGFPLPGMMTPTVDTDELGRRIADLRAVEGWLKSNLSMLQTTIQGLEMQRATLAALKTMAQEAPAAAGANPFASIFADPSHWPWNLAQPPATSSTEQTDKNEATTPAKAPAGKRKPKDTA